METRNVAQENIRITVIDRFLAATFLKLLPARVTPNQITIFRFFTVPFVAFFTYIEMYAIAIPLFVVSAFSDALDGALARTKNKITEWGTINDPIADKLLIMTMGIIIIPRYLNFIVVALLIFTEMFLIGAAYYYIRQHKKVIANIWGKIKMGLQSFGMGALLLYAVMPIPSVLIFAQVCIYFSILFALASIITHGA